MRPHPRVGLVYDVRNTSATGMDNPSLYAAIMDQVAWLDGRGLDLVWFTEHHFLDDDYLPSWIPVAGAYERNMYAFPATSVFCRSTIRFAWRNTLRCSITSAAGASSSV